MNYSAKVVSTARRLRKAGWSYRQIVEILEREHGVKPARQTVMTWTDEEYAERTRETRRRAHRREWRDRWEFKIATGDRLSQEYREAFVRRLADEGVRPPDIARVTAVVLPEPISEDRVRYLLRRGEDFVDRRRRENRVAA